MGREALGSHDPPFFKKIVAGSAEEKDEYVV